jgi:hypothetical protein
MIEVIENRVEVVVEPIQQTVNVQVIETAVQVVVDVIEEQNNNINQDNIAIVKRFRFITNDVNDSLDLLTALNSLPAYLVNETQSLWLIATKIVIDEFEQFNSKTILYKVINKGKGFYGSNQTQFTLSDLLYISTRNIIALDVEDDENTVVVNLGEHTNHIIQNVLNGQNPSIDIQDQSLGLTLFNVLDQDVTYTYLWIGAPGTYGLNDLQSTSIDFQLLENNERFVFNPSNYDLNDFNNLSSDPFVRESEIPTPEISTLQTAYNNSSSKQIITNEENSVIFRNNINDNNIVFATRNLLGTTTFALRSNGAIFSTNNIIGARLISSVHEAGDGVSFQEQTGNTRLRPFGSTVTLPNPADWRWDVKNRMQYEANYSTFFTPRTLVDKEYVDAIKITSNTNAINNRFYSANGTLTVTDPTPLNNEGYIVHVISGTTTIGGVGYTAGALVYRFYNGTAWTSTNMNSPITIDAVPTDGSSNAVSSNGVFGALNGKQRTLKDFDTKEGFYFFQDFLSDANSSTGWVSSFGGGTVTQVTTYPNRTNQQGVLALSTGTSATAVPQIRLGLSNSGSIFLGNGVFTMERFVNIENLSTATEEFFTIVGATTNANFNATGGICFLYDRSTINNPVYGAGSVNWKCITRLTVGTATVTTTSVPVTAGEWVKLTIVVNANATSVQFFINNILVATHTTNIPTLITPRVVHAKTIGTTARVLFVDYCLDEQIYTNPRL